ncbi:MAG: response regulator [Thermoplasmata archaeon]|nr:MAG: response regulator [Thermoplasmata archaeon]
MLHELYKDILKMKGHKIIGSAHNGMEGLEKLMDPSMNPDIVIMDHRMPLINGLEATEKLLKSKSGLRIIFISADVTVEKEALKLGAAAFVKKPFNIKSLNQVIDEALK